MGLLLLLIIIILLLGSVPAYPYSRTWGYGPSGILGVSTDHSGAVELGPLGMDVLANPEVCRDAAWAG
jgi:hypothetical protein